MRHAVLIALLLAASRTWAQPANPVYTDDSPAARDTLDRVGELVESGNDAQAVHALQKLLDEEGDRTLASADDPDLYRDVRDRVHRRLLAAPELLERYRQIEGPVAARMLDEGRARDAERTRLLTSAGYEAALRVAQSHLERARFEAARMALEQLERHPDRAERPEDAARMLALVASYVDRDPVWARAARWAADAGIDPPDPAADRLADRPPNADPDWRWAFGDIDEAALPEAPRRPLWSSALVPDAAQLPAGQSRGGRIPVTPDEVLWILPSAGGDTIYTNDGVWITAWDRYTLEVRWRTRPTTGTDPLLNDDITDQRLEPRNFGSRLEDPSTVTVAGRVVVATTGLAVGGAREGDPRVHALDAGTGRVIWSALLQRLDPSLDQAMPIGPALVSADTVVVAARKSIPGRRIISVSLVGLDLYSGRLRWIRPLASAGALPYVRTAGHSDGAVMHEGVFYRVDELGAVAAVEAATGRPRWIRTMTPLDFATRTSGSVYETNVPVVHDDALFVRSADRSAILKLDLRTGRLLARRPAGRFGSPRYLVGVGDHLAAVGTERIYTIEFDDFPDGAPDASPVFQDDGIHGRVVGMGRRLLVPTPRGGVVLDPRDPGRPESMVSLDHPGNVLPLGSALIAVDDVSIHSYLDWDVAEALLVERMEDHPADPVPAITYAELAFRAGHAEKVPDAAERALAAIGEMAARDEAAAARDRLFRSLRQMVELSQAAWDDATIDEPVIRDLDVMEGVITRLGQAADGPRQRAAALLVEGRLRDAMLEPGRAVEAYQAVLADDMLAAQPWKIDARRAGAGDEAARRIRDLVLRLGPGPYEPFEAEARRRVEALPPGAPAARLEDLAARYPASTVASRLWRRAADAHAAGNRPGDELRCLHSAVLAARVVHESGTDASPAPLAGAVAAQVRALAERGRYSGAAHTLHRFASEHPGIDLSAGDPSVTTDAMMSRLREALADATRPARVGAGLGSDVQSFVGWQLMEPMLRRDAPDPGVDHALMITADRVALFGDVGVDDDGRVGRLVELWSRTIDETNPALLRADPDAVYLAWDERRGVRIECIDAITGDTRWTSTPFRDLFEEDPAFEQMLANPSSLIRTPQRTNVHISDTLVAADEDTIAVVERTGRAAAFDDRTGQLLWTARTPPDRVYAADGAHGVLLVAGMRTNRPAGRPADAPATIQALDLRTGEPLATISGLPAEPEWVRVASPTTAIAHTRAGVHAYDLDSGERAWAIDRGPGLTAMAGWVFGEDLYLIDASRVLWHASAGTGELTPETITDEDRLSSVSQLRLVRLDERVGVFSSAGVLLLEGPRLVGADGLHPPGGLLTPLPTESRVVALEAIRRLDDDYRPLHMLHVLERDSARLQRTNVLKGLWDNPSTITVMDGRIGVTAGQLTFVYEMPPAAASEQAKGPERDGRGSEVD